MRGRIIYKHKRYSVKEKNYLNFTGGILRILTLSYKKKAAKKGGERRRENKEKNMVRFQRGEGKTSKGGKAQHKRRYCQPREIVLNQEKLDKKEWKGTFLGEDVLSESWRGSVGWGP